METIQYTGFTGATPTCSTGEKLVEEAWAAVPEIDELEFAEIRYASANEHHDWKAAKEAMDDIIRLKTERNIYKLQPKHNW